MRLGSMKKCVFSDPGIPKVIDRVGSGSGQNTDLKTIKRRFLSRGFDSREYVEVERARFWGSIVLWRNTLLPGGRNSGCWAGGGLTTLISLATKSDLHFSHSKLQVWPMIMGEINDCKLFKLWTIYYSLGSHTSQTSESPYWCRRSLSWRGGLKRSFTWRIEREKISWFEPPANWREF
jgi:hypothetical protein